MPSLGRKVEVMDNRAEHEMVVIVETGSGQDIQEIEFAGLAVIEQ